MSLLNKPEFLLTKLLHKHQSLILKEILDIVWKIGLRQIRITISQFKHKYKKIQRLNDIIMDSAKNIMGYQFPDLAGFQSCQLAHQLVLKGMREGHTG